MVSDSRTRPARSGAFVIEHGLQEAPMTFHAPLLFWAGLLIAIGVYFALRYFEIKRRGLLSRFASKHLLEELTENVSWQRRHIKQWLIVIVVALCFTALARPQYGYTWQEAKRRGVDIMFAVDTSRSMLTPDVNPDRLTRSKLAILDLLEKLEGDRVGLIAFAGGSFLQCPLTIDYNAFRQTVESLDTNIIPRGGTDIAGAIREAISSMTGNPDDRKTLIIITDGEENQGDAIAVAKQAAEKGIKIYTIGVGTPAGAVIPARNPDGSTGLVRDQSGEPVRSRLNETLLAQIAQVTGGYYSPLGQQGQALLDIYTRELGSLEKKETAEKMTRVPVERFQFPLALAILLLIIEFLLPDRKGRVRYRTLPSFRGKLPALLLGMMLLLGGNAARANPQEAQKNYLDGKYEEAQKLYSSASAKKPKDARLRFNTGVAAYKAGDLDAAEKDLSESLKTEDLILQQKALYNLGNVYYRQGQPLVEKSSQKTRQHWEKAIKSYEGAIALDNQDADAAYNLDYVKKKLEELKKQQDQKKDQQNQDKNKDDQKKQDQKNDSGQNQDQQDQDQKKDGENQKDNQSGQDGQQDKGDQKKDQDQGKDQQDKKQGDGDKKQDQDKSGEESGKNQDQQKGEKDKKQGEQKNQDSKSPGEKPQDDGKDPGQEEPGEGQLTPGQLNRQQAIQLLDSLKETEKKMPVFIEKPSIKNDQYKDW